MHAPLGKENHGERADCFIFLCVQLLALGKSAFHSGIQFSIPEELLSLNRGCRTGSKMKEKRRCYKPFILSITGNDGSSGGKKNKLSTLIGSQHIT